MVGLVVSTVETYFLQLLNKFLNSQDSISNNINQDFFQSRLGQVQILVNKSTFLRLGISKAFTVCLNLDQEIC
jgi:hypothetical protein